MFGRNLTAPLKNILRSPFDIPHAEDDLDLPAPVISSESIEIGKALCKAKKIGDIYELPYPLEVAPINHPELLASFYRRSGYPKVWCKLDLEKDTPSSEGEGAPHQFVAFKEIFQITGERTRRIIDVCRPTYNLEAKTYFEGNNSGLIMHGTGIHFDSPEAMPNGLVDLAVNVNGTFCLPHSDTGDLLRKSPLAPILNMPLDDPKLEEQLKIFYAVLMNRLKRRTCEKTTYGKLQGLKKDITSNMVRLPINTVNEITGITIHAQPFFVRHNRVCYKSVTNFYPANGS
jgi:hypothetical protein